MCIFCNIGSIVLGLGAWVMPLVSVKLRKFTPWLCAASFLLCSLSLLLQVVNVEHLCRIGDFSAIEDTIGAVSLAAIVLLILSGILNVFAVIQYKKQK